MKTLNMKVLISVTAFALLVAAVQSQGMPSEDTCLATDCKNGECIGTPAKCECYPGFIRSDNPNVCVDINECKIAPPGVDICGHGRCVNHPGRYSCVCHDYAIPIGRRFCAYNPRPPQNNLLNPNNWFYWKMLDEAFF